jgi:hypothetical protein
MSVALACLGVLLAGSQANAAQVRFVGGAVFLSATGTCADDNPTGNRTVARFRPEVPGSENGSGARVGLFRQDGAQGWRLNTGNFNVGSSSVFKVTEYSDVSDGPGTQESPVPRMRFLSQSPATINATTQVVTIVAEAQNFSYQAGCTARFRMVLQRRPD